MTTSSASGPAAGRPNARAGSKSGWPRRWQLAGLLVVIATVVTAVVVSGAPGRHPARRGPSSAANSGSQLLAAEAVIRGETTTWITSQVGHDAIVACDAAMCADLAQHGFPAGNLNVLRPAAVDPYGSQLVVATASIRSLFGGKLDAVYAPMVIASFGTGTARIDVRVVAADGPRVYADALAADVKARKSAGASLAKNRRITLSAAARDQLRSGQVDIRLITAIAFAAGQEPVRILAFSGAEPGASPGAPLRWAYLSEHGSGRAAARRTYLKSLLATIRALRPPYAPLSVTAVRLPGRVAALLIEFAAPSPLGLLKS